MKIAPYNPDTLEEAIEILKNGGVIAHPADTCYGLAADLMNPEALKRIHKIKKRHIGKPMSIMLPVIAKPNLEQYTKLNDFAKFVTSKLLPGPVTILLPKGPKIPKHYYLKFPLIGLRIPYDIMTQDLLGKFKKPLITTSANIAEGSPCATCCEVKTIFEKAEHKPDLIFEGAVRNVCMASTIIKLQKNKIKITRKGPMTAGQLEGILGVKVEE